FVRSQRSISLKRLATSIELALIISTTMFTVLVQAHIVSSFSNEVTLLVAALKLTMFVLHKIVFSQIMMSLESSATLVAHPFGSVGVMCFEVSCQLIPGNEKNVSKSINNLL